MNNELIDVKTLKPFTRFIYTIGVLPTSYLMSMTYEEQLIWLCNYLSETVIPTINNNGQAVTELQNLYVELKEYVDNYFENLDIQEEINNKLDDMAESGQLTDIIAQYLGLAGILAYNTVTDMKEAQNIANGSICKTLGYNSINDGGQATYKVRNVINTDVIDEGNIISLLDQSLVAEIVETNPNAKQFGCYGDGENDDTEKLNTYIEYCNTNNKNIILPYGNYLITDDLISINSGLSIIGEYENNGVFGNKTTIIDERTSENYLIQFTGNNLGSYIKNIRFNANNEDNSLNAILVKNIGYLSLIENCNFEFYKTCLDFDRVNAIKVNNNVIYKCGSRETNSLDYAIKITGSVDIVFDNLLAEWTRYIILDDSRNYTGHSHKFTNCYFELYPDDIIDGYAPINCNSGNYGGTIFDGCTFVSTPIKDMISILSKTAIQCYNMVALDKCIVTNSKFECGRGTGQGENNGQGKYITATNSIITNNMFYDTLYLSFGITVVGSIFDNNKVDINIASADESSIANTNFVIANDSSKCENDTLHIRLQTENDLSVLPRLFKSYHNHFITSKTPTVTDKYNYHNFYEYGTGNNVGTFVVNCSDTIYSMFEINIKRNNAGELAYSGKVFVNFATNSITLIENYVKSFGGSNDILLSKIDSNNLAIQVIATNQNNLNVEIKGLENQKMNIYFDKSKNTQISSATQLSLKA